MALTLNDLKAEMLKALAHPTRVALAEALGRSGETCVCDLVEAVGSGDRSTVSKHLAVMKSAGVVVDRKDGLKVFYRLNCPCLTQFLGCIEQMVRDRFRVHQEALERENPAGLP